MRSPDTETSNFSGKVSGSRRGSLLSQEDVSTLVGYLLDEDVTQEERTYLLINAGLQGRSAATDSNGGRLSNEKVCTTDFLSAYFTNRALGLSQADSASMLGVSPHRMKRMLLGHGLSPQKHKALVMAEIQARPSFKKKHLEIVTRAAENDWRASLALLERLEADEFAAQKCDVNVTQVAMNGNEILAEKLSRLSVEELKRLAYGDTDEP